MILKLATLSITQYLPTIPIDYFISIIDIDYFVSHNNLNLSVQVGLGFRLDSNYHYYFIIDLGILQVLFSNFARKLKKIMVKIKNLEISIIVSPNYEKEKEDSCHS